MKKSAAPPAPPPAPDPASAIYAQARALPSRYTPQGSAVYTGDPNSGNFAVHETLSPTEQRLYDTRSQIAQSMLDRSRATAGSMPTSFEFRGAEDPTTNLHFTEQSKMLDKVFGRQEEDLEQRLANKGLPMGSEAFKEDMGDFRSSRADAYSKAASDALQLGYQQQLGTRQQNMAEIAAAMGAGEVQAPTAAGNVIDTQGPAAMAEAGRTRQHQGDMAAYNARIAQQNNMMGGLFGLGSAFLLSDRRLKTDIRLLREFMPGINLYAFRYLTDHEGMQRIGFMADEVERVIPEAVMTNLAGYKLVNYRRVLNSGNYRADV